jgi:hypothetical protein
VARAARPGSRRVGRAAALLLTAVTAATVVLAVGLALSHGGTAANRHGSLPGWLPKSTLPVARVVTASAAHPWLAVEGDTVRADLRRGDTLVTAVGPTVPEEGAIPVPTTSPCSFTVTFARTAGSVPLTASAFTITDELGHLHHPLVARAGGGALPARVRPGQTITLTVSGVLPTGAGTLHWAPTGDAALVSWDFDVEID